MTFQSFQELSVLEKELAQAVKKTPKVQYDEFFSLYAKSVRKKKPFQSLGYIPGPAVILDFRDVEKIRILDATPEVGINTLPTPWMKRQDLPEQIRQGLAAYTIMVEGLGYKPTPYQFGLAKSVLEGYPPKKYLAMIMARFKYRPTDPELPFGVALLTVSEGGKVMGLKVKTYNPCLIPDVPAEGTIFSLTELRNGQGPVQKLLKIWALLENNYFSRYDRNGYYR